MATQGRTVQIEEEPKPVDEEGDDEATVDEDERAAEVYAALDEVAIDEVDDPVEAELEVSTDSLQLFLKDVGRVDLLTAAQEVELAKRIERGDHRAKQEMIEANLRLLVSIAERHPHPGPPVPRMV